jgi:hypothetical protein
MVRYLNFPDSQLGAAGEFKICAAAWTQSDGTLDFDLAAARTALRAPESLHDFQHRAGKRRSVGGDFKTEADGIGHYSGELADFEQHANYFGVAATFSYRFDDTLSDR